MRKPTTLVVVAAALTGCGWAQGPKYPDFAVPRLSGVTIAGLPAVTGRIHVDQFGYLPFEEKVAVVSDPVRGYNAGDSYAPGSKLEVRAKKGGRVVFAATPKPWRSGSVHEDSGDRGWWFDFSSVRTVGEYYVYDPSSRLRSPVFKIGLDVYKPVLRAAVRTFYYQRLSMALREPFAEKPWILPSYRDEDRTARALWARDDASTERDLSGGWMDAGDTNKYPPFNGDALSSLLYAYTRNPAAFTDDFGIPESGNGLPDLLDEVKYQYDWLVKMQDSDGGVFIKMGNLRDRRGDDRRYYGPKDTGATITSCMNFAHGSRVFGRFKPWKAFAESLKQRALRAWDYYRTHPRTYNLDAGEISAGIANRSAEEQDQLEAVAAIHLFALTGKKEFHDAVLAKAAALRQLKEPIWSPYGSGIGEALTDYLSLPNADKKLSSRIRAQLAASARSARFAPQPEADLYRAWMNPEAYHWGSNTVRASFGFASLLATDFGGLDSASQSRLKQRARDMLHSFHGVNPLSATLLTNMERLGAALSVKRIWHERFNYDTPFADNPPPGYVVGGANQSYGGRKGTRPGEVDWIKQQPRAKAYADFNEPWPANSWEITENAIYYQAAYIRLLSGVMRR